MTMMIQRRNLVAITISVFITFIAGLVPAGGADGTTIQGFIGVPHARDNANVVVYIEKIPGNTFSPPVTPVRLNQANLTFTPHVLPVMVGTRVVFPNGDDTRHNVFSPTAGSKFDLGSYPRGSSKTHVFDKPGLVTLLCNVHAEMSAHILVTETPYFATTDKSGYFAIPSVPPGKYVLKTWHENSKPERVEIEVRAGESLTVPFELRK